MDSGCDPGDRKTAVLQFRFINRPRIYKKGVLEITPTKAFSTCSEANLADDVIHDDIKPTESNDDRGPAMEVQPDTCDRQLKNPIEISL